MIYLMRVTNECEFYSLFKIGYSASPVARSKELTRAKGLKHTVVYQHEVRTQDQLVESMLHNYYRLYSVKDAAEYFDLAMLEFVVNQNRDGWQDLKIIDEFLVISKHHFLL